MITKKQDVVNMINHLRGTSQVEINKDYNKPVKLDVAFGKNNGYFLCGLEKKLDRRAKKEDIKTKKYFVVDIDIRINYMDHNDNKILTQDELDIEIKNIMGLLEKKGFDEYSYLVATGNGIHIYFVGDEQELTVEEYRFGVEAIFDSIDLALKDTPYETDRAMEKIAQISRLPGSINMRKKTHNGVDFDLGAYECRILVNKPRTSNLFNNIKTLGADKLEKDRILQENHRKEEMERLSKFTSSEQDICAAINKIPLEDLICADYGVTVKYGKNFYTGNKRHGFAIDTERNSMYHGGTNKLNFGSEGQVYNTFKYLKEQHNLDAKGVFKRAEDNFDSIRELAEASRKRWGEEQREKKKMEQSKIEVIEGAEYDLDRIVPYTWGTNGLDKAFGRYDIGLFNIIVGESQMGKTEYTLFQAKKNADKGLKVAYIALEMTKEAMITRVAMKKAGITKAERDDKNFSDSKKKGLRRNMKN